VIVGEGGGRIITLLSLLSLPPLVNAILMIGTRILFGLGRDGLFSRATASVNDRGTPAVAMLVTAGIAAALVATGTFQKLVAVASFFLALNYCVSCVALFVLRSREPEAERPFRAWGYPWSAGVVLAGAVAFLVATLIADRLTAAAGLALLAAGFVVRAMLVRRG
jgi:APA family basic amino acid/polyamine antiporter